MAGSRVNADALQGLAGIACAAVGVGFWAGWPAGLCAFGLLVYADLLRGKVER